MLQITDLCLHISHAAICEDLGSLSYFQTSFVKKNLGFAASRELYFEVWLLYTRIMYRAFVVILLYMRASDSKKMQILKEMRILKEMQYVVV